MFARYKYLALLSIMAAGLGIALPSGSSEHHDRGTPKGCLRFPLQGVKVLSERSMAIISQDGDVSIVRLSGPCLKGKHPDIVMRPSTNADVICKKRDIDEVINGALQQYVRIGDAPADIQELDMQGHCVVTDYYYVGHLDAKGYIVDDDGHPITGVDQIKVSGDQSFSDRP